MTEIRMMVGIPGSGKSTLAQKWLANGEVDVIVSSDAIREELTGDPRIQDGRIWAIFYLRITEALNDGKVVVADATHLTPKTWKPLRKLAENWQVPLTAHVMRTPLVVSSKRNFERERVVPVDAMYRMANNYDEWTGTKTLAQHGFKVVEHYDS